MGEWSEREGMYVAYAGIFKLYLFRVKFPNPLYEVRANCLPISFRGAFPADAESFDSASCCSQSYHRRRQP